MTKQPTRVVRIVGVVCPDRYDIHKEALGGPYVRYAILFDAGNGCTWIDDPNIFDLQGVASAAGIEVEWVLAHCPWCLARAEAS